MSDAILVMKDITKTFPGVLALDKASLSVLPGEIHGLVGENGAGKSTIIKVLAGVYQAQGGSLSVNNTLISSVTPQAIHDAGVRFIHQELHLVPHFSVAESVFMGQELTGPFGLLRKQMRIRSEEFLRKTLDVKIDGNTLIRDLGTAERKLVQIARALIDNQARLVVFDEPTAPLASGEVGKLLAAIRRLKERGIAMIYVSHYLSEITNICDRVTVFRNGQTVAVFNEIKKDSAGALIEAMVGREIKNLYPKNSHSPSSPAIQAKNLGDGKSFHDVSFTLHSGEVVGIAGLIGSGRAELIDTLYGLRQATSGEIWLNNKTIQLSSPADAVTRGMVLVPRDRRHDGLVLGMSVSENVNLGSLKDVSKMGIEMRAMALARAAKQIKDLDIRPPNPSMIARLLSGGNQQKTVLGRWLTTNAKVFLLDEPTVGVDVGAKVEIYQLVETLAQNGAGVLLSSSDPGELIGLCDRILVMMRGRITHEIDTDGLSIDRLVAMTTGATGSSVTRNKSVGAANE